MDLTKLKVGIVDYGAGNICSVASALKRMQVSSSLFQNPHDINSFDAVILPGVGHFGYAMQSLRSNGLKDVLIDAAKSGTPMLGICLGMHLMGLASIESKSEDGLCLLNFWVDSFSDKTNEKNNIGWLPLEIDRPSSKLALSKFQDRTAYFVHGYYVSQLNSEEKIFATSSKRFIAAFRQKNLWACQFHPEKSGRLGNEFLQNFILNIKNKSNE